MLQVKTTGFSSVLALVGPTVRFTGLYRTDGWMQMKINLKEADAPEEKELKHSSDR